MKSKILQLIQQSIWLTPEQRLRLTKAVNEDQLDSAQLQKINSILEKSQKIQEQDKFRLFQNHPDVKSELIKRLDTIIKHLLQEREIYLTKTEENQIKTLKKQIDNL